MFNFFRKQGEAPDKFTQALLKACTGCVQTHCERMLPQVRGDARTAALDVHLAPFASGKYLELVGNALTDAYREIWNVGVGKTVEIDDPKFNIIVSAFHTDNLPRAAATFEGGYVAWVKGKYHKTMTRGNLRPLIHWITMHAPGGDVMVAHVTVLDEPRAFFALDLFNQIEMRKASDPDTRPAEVQRQWREA